MTENEDWHEINRKNVDAFRANHGKLGGYFEGSPLLILHSIGARTGRQRVTPLTYLPDGDRFVAFGTNSGNPENPAWFYNVVAHPTVTLEVGDETFQATAAVAGEAERDELFARHVVALPRFAAYKEKTERSIPAVVFTRTPDA
jgi:deazaflavin-dependent oxidoreductase (nitroreductase family)